MSNLLSPIVLPQGPPGPPGPPGPQVSLCVRVVNVDFVLLRFIQDLLKGSKRKNHRLHERLHSTRFSVLAAYHGKLILHWDHHPEKIKPVLEPDLICYCSHSSFPWTENPCSLHNIQFYLHGKNIWAHCSSPFRCFYLAFKAIKNLAKEMLDFFMTLLSGWLKKALVAWDFK